MTDFLTRLAQRTLGLATVVQPRIASRYVPAAEVMIANDYISNASSNLEPASESATTSDQFVTAQTSIESLNVDIFPSLSSTESELRPTQFETILSLSTSSTNSNQDSFLVTSGASIHTTPHLIPSRDNNTITSFTSYLTASLSNSQSLSLSSQSTSVKNSSESLAQSFSLLPRQSLQPDPPRNERVELQQLSSSSSLKELSSSPLHQLLQQTELNLLRSVNSPLVPSTITNSSSFNIQEGGTLSIAATQSSPVHLPSSITQPINQPEPVIEIRIGRIEVRGTQPQTSKPRSRSTPSTPALSLTEYLNKRDGGKQ